MRTIPCALIAERIVRSASEADPFDSTDLWVEPPMPAAPDFDLATLDFTKPIATKAQI